MQAQAYKYYEAQAAKVGLDKHYRDLVESGAIAIEEVTNKSLAKKIEKYQEW